MYADTHSFIVHFLYHKVGDGIADADFICLVMENLSFFLSCARKLTKKDLRFFCVFSRLN